MTCSKYRNCTIPAQNCVGSKQKSYKQRELKFVQEKANIEYTRWWSVL